MDGLDEAWSLAAPSRVFTAGVAVGGLVGFLVGSAIGVTMGQRSVRSLRHLIEDLIRRTDRVDFELLAQ